LQMQMEEHKETTQVNFINWMFIHNLAKTISITILLIFWTLLQLQHLLSNLLIPTNLDKKRIMFEWIIQDLIHSIGTTFI
jgi:hypothetical protein